ncbi:UPF0149 family protein [Aliiglaciecola litoralis]|uniref:YecA family protein n=1 Tax=Aliiglaciecola litoralis TaxID=582857 RepID=A0ABN1LP64_9ALTE
MPFATPPHVLQLQQLCDLEFKSTLHSSDYVGGLVFSVCAAPEIPMPDEWLNWVFNQHGQLASAQDADKIAETLMSVLQQQLTEMRSETFRIPMQGQTLPEDPNSNMPVSKWLKGLLVGHSQLEAVWQRCWQELVEKQPEKLPSLKRNLKHCLMMFSTFANVPMAVEQAQRAGNHKLLDNIDKIYASLPDALKTYVEVSGQLAQHLPEQFETFQKTPE